MQEDPKCPRCGYTLKIVLVRVPIPLNASYTMDQNPPSNERVYETREEVSDCPRCTGSY